jgi:hypothetical protein
MSRPTHTRRPDAHTWTCRAGLAGEARGTRDPLILYVVERWLAPLSASP